ncbi:toxin Cry1Ac domain D-VI-related protein, partial [Listeria cornellensis]
PAYKTLVMQDMNVYLPYLSLDGNYLIISMTKIIKNYGVSVTLPNGQIITKFKTLAVNIPEDFVIYVGDMDLRSQPYGAIFVDKIYPTGKSYGDLKYSFWVDTKDFPKYDTKYGQAVYNLYKDATLTTIGAGVTQADIDIATNAAKTVSASPEKTRLANLIEAAQTQVTNIKLEKEQAARDAVNALFTNNDPTSGAIKGATDQDAINNAKTLIDQVTDPAVKTALEADLATAQALLEARNAAEELARQNAAEKAVNELFTSDKPATDTIKAATNQDAINAAQALIDVVTEKAPKDALQNNLDRAQELLNARTATEKANSEAAEKAVNELFTDNKPATDTIKATTDQGAINAAQQLVDVVVDPTTKAPLQNNLDRAQELLNAKLAAEKAKDEAAEKAVNALFKDDKPATDAIKASTDQPAINAAQKAIDGVTDPALKTELQKKSRPCTRTFK